MGRMNATKLEVILMDVNLVAILVHNPGIDAYYGQVWFCMGVWPLSN